MPAAMEGLVLDREARNALHPEDMAEPIIDGA